MGDRITVFGATGFTGRLVCSALARRGLPFAIAGRSRARLRALADDVGAEDVIVADAHRAASLGAVVASPTRVLVSCAGPFLRHGWPVARAAVGAGVSYLDTTGEQPFILRVARELDDPARAGGCTLVSAMAMEYAVGDWTAAVAMARSGAARFREVTVAYSFTEGHVSRGTALSILGMLGVRGHSLEHGTLRRRRTASLRRRIVFPFGGRTCGWMPFGEPVFLSRRGTVDTGLSFMRLPAVAARVMHWGAPLTAATAPLVRAAIRPLLPARRQGPGERERRGSRFTIVAEADGFRAVASGSDPYGLTAEIIAMGAARLLGGGAPAGFQTPATLGLDPGAALGEAGVLLE